jgi:hypothetical protein
VKLFKNLHLRRTEDQAKADTSQALLEETCRTEPEALEMQRQAQELLARAEEQAQRLQAADHRNHYSESLTHAFRGRTA